MLAPPGPRNRSRDEISDGRCHITAVPRGGCFVFFCLATTPTSTVERHRTTASRITVRNFTVCIGSPKPRLGKRGGMGMFRGTALLEGRSEEHTSELQSLAYLV